MPSTPPRPYLRLSAEIRRAQIADAARGIALQLVLLTRSVEALLRLPARTRLSEPSASAPRSSS
jgi:hypothetical protein